MCGHDLLPQGSLPEDEGRPEDDEPGLDGDGERILVAERDVIKCIAYFTEKGFEPPCPFDHPFAVWAAWLWMVKFSIENIRFFYDEYVKSGDEGEAMMEEVRQSLATTLDEFLAREGEGDGSG